MTIRAVEADLGIALADGRTVLLAGIDPVRADGSAAPLAGEARSRLAAWLTDRPATLQAMTAAPDRWGRTPALLFAPTPQAGAGATPLSVALALVDAGLARGRPDPQLHACWPAIIAAETAARSAGLGLWGDPYYAVRDAGDGSATSGLAGSLAIVEGRVARVGHGRSRLFIEVGTGEANVTLILARRNSFILGQLGLDEVRLNGAKLRARGFLDDRFGPSIEITDPDQLEALDRHGSSEALRVGPVR